MKMDSIITGVSVYFMSPLGRSSWMSSDGNPIFCASCCSCHSSKCYNKTSRRIQIISHLARLPKLFFGYLAADNQFTMQTSQIGIRGQNLLSPPDFFFGQWPSRRKAHVNRWRRRTAFGCRALGNQCLCQRVLETVTFSLRVETRRGRWGELELERRIVN